MKAHTVKSDCKSAVHWLIPTNETSLSNANNHLILKGLSNYHQMKQQSSQLFAGSFGARHSGTFDRRKSR
jgi:hypothetical protein